MQNIYRAAHIPHEPDIGAAPIFTAWCLLSSPGEDSALQVGIFQVGFVEHGPVHEHVRQVGVLKIGLR